MDIVDAQIHAFYTLDLDQTIAAMNALGIQSAIIDELWEYDPRGFVLPGTLLSGGVFRPSSPLAQAAALKYPDRFSVLQRVDRRDPDIEAVFASLRCMPGCRSIRLVTRGAEELQAIADGGYDRMLQLAADQDLVVSLLGAGVSDILGSFLPRFPRLRFVLDHCGAPKDAQAWDNILAAARTHSNLWIKWSHAQHYFPSAAFPFAELLVPLRQALDAFGRERVIWASDFTHNRRGASWGELLFSIRCADDLPSDDKEWLLGRAARALYAWPKPEQAFVAPHVPLLPKQAPVSAMASATS
ncbi:amidohydrolase family protein [Paraburkholderia sp. J41]|uniref:amidohydrolase family protein n=1 Tax=Paraburkholderia sp. J41 TaxID=2805433 RepID=UPI002AC33827|nr:amidohydrolase family protein [Paraburkholderia sp. J41]